MTVGERCRGIRSRDLGLRTGDNATRSVVLSGGDDRADTQPASERLYEAETTAASAQHRAQHHSNAPNAFRSEIYAPGTEYALSQAIAQLMSAVVGVLNESLTESIKAFYRLRKAYIALDAILKMEEKFMESREPSGELLTSSSDLSKVGATKSNSSNRSLGKGPSVAAHSIATDEKDLTQSLSGLNVNDPASDVSGTSTPTGSNIINHDPDSDIFKNEVDVFVHSGANFCFGILLLLISMVPPAFSKLLSIIGFHGDKQRGLRMLWQASKFHNLIGAMAALALLGYYNGFVRYCDIMPDPTPGEDGVEGYPQERLAALLAEMRSRFPNSRLWLLEESRMKGANKDLDGALELLCSKNKSPLKQVEALCVFEKSLNALFLHRYDVCSDAFIEVSFLVIFQFVFTSSSFASSEVKTNWRSVWTSIPGLVPCTTTSPDPATSCSTATASIKIPSKPRSTPRQPPNTSVKPHRWQARRSSWRANCHSTFS